MAFGIVYIIFVFKFIDIQNRLEYEMEQKNVLICLSNQIHLTCKFFNEIYINPFHGGLLTTYFGVEGCTFVTHFVSRPIKVLPKLRRKVSELLLREGTK